MVNAREKVAEVNALLNESRIATGRREDIQRKLRTLAGEHGGSTPVTVDNVPAPDAPGADTWAGISYWLTRDIAKARLEQPGFARVRAVNIDSMSDFDRQNRRAPAAWAPRVEVTFAAVASKDQDGHREVLGDLSHQDAIAFAMDLLAAAQLIER